MIQENKKARFDYNIILEISCGIKLMGTEVKPLRKGDSSINQAYCYIKDNELYIKNMHIGEHKCAKNFNHDPIRDRKLLLKRKEINDIIELLKTDKTLTIIPLKLFLNNNLFKITIGVCKGKKNYDRRDSIKKKDIQRDTNRELMKYK